MKPLIFFLSLFPLCIFGQYEVKFQKNLDKEGGIKDIIEASTNQLIVITDFSIYKMNYDGKIIWKFDAWDASDENSLSGVAETSTGGFLVTGRHSDGRSMQGVSGKHRYSYGRYFMLNKNGKLVWDKNLDDRTYPIVNKYRKDYIIIFFKGNTYKINVRNGELIYGDYDNSNKDEISMWEGSYAGRQGIFSIGEDIKPSHKYRSGISKIGLRDDGVVIVGCTLYDTTDVHIFVEKLDRFGKRVWVQYFGNKGDAVPLCVYETSNGDLWIGGFTSKNAYEKIAYVLKINNQGEKLWEWENSINNNNVSSISTIIENSKGDIFIGGSYSNEFIPNAWIMKF